MAVPTFFLNDYVAHRLLLVSCLTAVKTNEDYFVTNKIFAEVGGITLPQLNDHEAEYLFALDFNLNISNEDYIKTKNHLFSYSAQDNQAVTEKIKDPEPSTKIQKPSF